jgi:DnaJ domain
MAKKVKKTPAQDAIYNDRKQHMIDALAQRARDKQAQEPPPENEPVAPAMHMHDPDVAPHLFKKWVGDRDAVVRVRNCDNPNCGERGDFRAPRSRHDLDQHYWFCLPHVQSYNAAWDYYKGMTVEQIEDAVRYGATWERPTWPLGNRKMERKVRDAFKRAFDDDNPEDNAESIHAKAESRGVDPRYIAQLNALRELGLTPPIDFEGIKKRYRDLVKTHHPDVQGGKAEAEEKLKRINSAFTILKLFYVDESVMNSEA